MKLIDDNIDFNEWRALEDAHKVRPASDYRAEVIASLSGDRKTEGYDLPWQSCRGKFQIRPGELTLWAGINGHKKSTVTSQVALSAMQDGARVLVASLEMQPYKTVERMVKQAAVRCDPEVEYINGFSEWTDGKLWIYDRLGNVSQEKIIGVMNYAIQVFGVDQIIIDSLMKCRIGSEDYNGQKEFVNDLTGLCLAKKVHIHMVVHARKGKNETDRIGKFDVKGASEIVDQADNVLLVQKNLSKTPERIDEPDVWMTVSKQRHGKWEGVLNLWDCGETFNLMERGKNPQPVEFKGLMVDL